MVRKDLLGALMIISTNGWVCQYFALTGLISDNALT